VIRILFTKSARVSLALSLEPNAYKLLIYQTSQLLSIFAQVQGLGYNFVY